MASADATVVQVASDDTVPAVLFERDGNREAGLIFNDSSSVLYVKLGDVADPTDYSVRVAAGGFYEVVGYTGLVTGIWATVNGFAYCTALTD